MSSMQLVGAGDAVGAADGARVNRLISPTEQILSPMRLSV